MASMDDIMKTLVDIQEKQNALIEKMNILLIDVQGKYVNEHKNKKEYRAVPKEKESKEKVPKPTSDSKAKKKKAIHYWFAEEFGNGNESIQQFYTPDEVKSVTTTLADVKKKPIDKLTQKNIGTALWGSFSKEKKDLIRKFYVTYDSSAVLVTPTPTPVESDADDE
jgi:hypothetical protein